ncbi:Imm30 family immunity protein [Metabacillus fastidiosus]|uniref:Imm30 family immunity protein n=1 Tax=Metabacillus fastidiosus TaxID=1458 RepID=UPI002E20C895|nr:Imm30 family immunity protein [Metabacillus fastidiosus]
MDIRPEIKRLYDCRLLTNELEYEEFDNILEKLADCTDEKIIKELCMVFDDETEEEEIMFGLVHLIEDFDMEKYLTEMPRALPKMIENAKEWAMILNRRILNDDLYRAEYAKIITHMNDDKKLTVINLLNEIISDNPKRFENIANEILSQVKS